MSVRTRFAPSPTGFLHIGGLRTAIYSFAMAKHESGQFLLRIEDTDQKRLVLNAVEKIYSVLKSFGIIWDEEVVVQSVRAKSGVYRQAAESLIASGHAFYCQCVGKNAKTDGYSTILRDPCRDKKLTTGAIKLRVPDGQKLSFKDFVLKKEVVWESDKIADTVLLKSDGVLPTYHLAMAVDDHDSAITHVIRSMEWLTSTPIHILVHKYLGFDLPKIGHPSAILDPSGGKLSKRKGNVSVEQFLAEGYLPEAITNFVILLGWAPKNNRELFTLPEFVTEFDPAGFQKSNPIMNLEKLNWFNGQYMRKKTDEEICILVKPFMKNPDTKIDHIVPLIKDRLIKLTDIDSLISPFFTPPTVSSDLWLDSVQSKSHLEVAQQVFSSVTWEKAAIEVELVKAVKDHGWKNGDFFMSLRIAIFGGKFTPPITDVMLVIGKSESVSRIASAIQQLRQ